jgi:hypothetical protein
LTLCEVAVSSRLSVCLLFLSCAVWAAPCTAQNPRQSTPPVVPSPRGDVTPTDEEEAHTRLAHDMEKKAAKERVAALKIDTDKLLKLSVELKQYVDKSDENVLSLDVIKKAEEIEKLAHSVRDKMKGPN